MGAMMATSTAVKYKSNVIGDPARRVQVKTMAESLVGCRAAVNAPPAHLEQLAANRCSWFQGPGAT